MGDTKVELDPDRITLAVGVNPRGVYTNAIRVITESDQETLLDFLLYSPVDSSAEVVARVRVSANFLVALQQRLAEAVQPLLLLKRHTEGKLPQN